MKIQIVGFVVIAAFALLTIGCDTCKERCDFAADFYEECLSEWNTSWEGLGYEDKGTFRDACVESVNDGRAQVSDCCSSVEENPDLTAEEIEENQAECEDNTLLAIDRNCEDNKELYRQPCSLYWQEVYDPFAPGFPEENPTCQDEGEGDDDSAS